LRPSNGFTGPASSERLVRTPGPMASILANSEDGTLYRWDLATNWFTQSVNLTSGIAQAYTPTVIGVDCTAYAINNATLFAVA